MHPEIALAKAVAEEDAKALWAEVLGEFHREVDRLDVGDSEKAKVAAGVGLLFSKEAFLAKLVKAERLRIFAASLEALPDRPFDNAAVRP